MTLKTSASLQNENQNNTEQLEINKIHKARLDNFEIRIDDIDDRLKLRFKIDIESEKARLKRAVSYLHEIESKILGDRYQDKIIKPGLYQIIGELVDNKREILARTGSVTYEGMKERALLESQAMLYAIVMQISLLSEDLNSIQEMLKEDDNGSRT